MKNPPKRSFWSLGRYAFAAQLISGRLILLQIALLHVFVTAVSARLVRLAQKTASPDGLGLLPLEVHVRIQSLPVRPYGTRS